MKKLLNCKKGNLFLFLFMLSLIGLILRVFLLWRDSTSFTYDQGRDFLDLREMWILRKVRLIGPTTSLHGLFSGPFWYWLCFPFFLLTNGDPLANLIPLLLFSFLAPLIILLLIENKKLGLILGIFYIFSSPFISSSLVALNTNPVIFLTPILLLFLAKFFATGKKFFIAVALFLISTFFHFEPLAGIFLLAGFLISVFLFKRGKFIFENKKLWLAFILPFLPQIIFDFRHDFIQTKTIWRFFALGEGSLTSVNKGLVSRFLDRLEVFKNVWIFLLGNSVLLGILILFLTVFLIVKVLKNKSKDEDYYFILTSLIFLAVVFLCFVFYPYALWVWYLGVVDGLVAILIAFGVYFLWSWRNKIFSFLAFSILVIIVYFNLKKYSPWFFEKGFSSDPANLRTRIEVIDSIYKDAGGKGINVFTFAPYVYDYPYQYLIWWRAKTKHHYLPEKYYYLANQPEYVPAKGIADKLIPSKKAECDYLIIEPFESQEEWFLRWRGNFSEAKKIWQIGQTKIEKLCAD